MSLPSHLRLAEKPGSSYCSFMKGQREPLPMAAKLTSKQDHVKVLWRAGDKTRYCGMLRFTSFTSEATVITSVEHEQLVCKRERSLAM